jgi:hypothetical protein
MRRLRPLVLIGVTALAVAACAGSTPSTPSPPTTGVQPPASATPPPAIALGSPTVGPYGLAIDPSLLAVLPATLGDLPVSESADVEAPVLQDSELPKHAESYAGAVVGDLGGSDWATASVVKLKAESRTDAYLSSWRSDFDAAACEQAGGVASEETLQSGVRAVQHVTCEGGVDLYHVWLPERGEIVSVTSLGPLRLGWQLVQALQT